MICLAIISSCAHLGKEEKPGLVQHESSSVRCLGYKMTVRAKTSPQEIEQYLLNPDNLSAKTGAYEFAKVSGGKMEKLGDTVKFKFEVAGLSFPLKFTLVNWIPGEEILYLGQADIGVMGFLRFKFKKMEDGTKVTLTYGQEDTKSFLGELSDVVNITEAMAKLFEVEVAQGQAYFDPSLKPEQLLEQGMRGEFYDSFFQYYKVSVWINASPKKVNSYILDPKTWEAWKEKFGHDFGPCVGREYSGPCRARLKILGVDYEFNSFMLSFKNADHSISYWVSDQIIARSQLLMKPEQGGCRFTAIYTMELPPAISQEGGGLLVSMLQLPKYLEQLLIDIKNGSEGIS